MQWVMSFMFRQPLIMSAASASRPLRPYTLHLKSRDRVFKALRNNSNRTAVKHTCVKRYMQPLSSLHYFVTDVLVGTASKGSQD